LQNGRNSIRQVSVTTGLPQTAKAAQCDRKPMFIIKLCCDRQILEKIVLCLPPLPLLLRYYAQVVQYRCFHFFSGLTVQRRLHVQQTERFLVRRLSGCVLLQPKLSIGDIAQNTNQLSPKRTPQCRLWVCLQPGKDGLAEGQPPPLSLVTSK
jgi:hypothetical protein